MKKRISLSSTLRIFFILSLIIPLFIISAIAVKYSGDFLIDEYTNINNQTINYLKYSVENFIIIPSKNLISIAYLIEDMEDKESIDNIVDALATKDIDFSKVIILDESGTVEYAFPSDRESIVGFDYSLESTFINIKNGEDEFWSDTYIDSESEKVAVDYAVKLKDKVLVGTILLEEFRKFADVIKYSDDILIGVTDKTGVYIFHTDYRNVEQRITDENVNVRTLIFEKVFIDKKEYYGTIVSSDYLDWSVILYLPVEQIDSELNKFIAVLVVLIAISIFLVLLLGNTITSRIIKNLNNLIGVTNKIGRGNYEIEDSEVNYKEFVEIMVNFDSMTSEISHRENLIMKQKDDINALNEELEERVEERTNELKNANSMLESMIIELNETQEQLIEREKLASLGNLVAGVSHELNTPIGVILTSITYISDESKKLKNKILNSALKKSELVEFLDTLSESEKIMMYNINRTSDLISSFKLISTDNSVNDFRDFNVEEYISNIITSLEPQLKKSDIDVELKVLDDGISLFTNPSYLYHVVTNIILNTIIHAYTDGGKVLVKIEDDNNNVKISVQDFGIGISEDDIKRIFEPFFTTKRGLGGSGLGLNIAYNTVVQNLKGSISCASKLGQGTSFIITIPK